jgi:cell division septation protein DedD
MSEEGFHEIQLSGKQLVFLFMATTVVSVVIFLLGVIVGRQVKAETLIADATGTSIDMAADQAPALPETLPGETPGPGEPPAPVAEPDQFSYHERLQQQSAAAAEEPAPATPEPAPAAAAPAQTPEPPAAPPAASGWVVQIGAYKDRATADRVVSTLTRQQFPAFVLAPTAGSPTATFRVRVGPYSERREAETIAGRLQREHQYSPFVTR